MSLIIVSKQIRMAATPLYPLWNINSVLALAGLVSTATGDQSMMKGNTIELWGK